MIRDGVKGKIVFVSSVLGYFSIVGYSPYSPGKFALRGKANPSVYFGRERAGAQQGE